MASKLQSSGTSLPKKSLESWLLVGEPRIYEEKWPNLSLSSYHLRLPVTAQGASAIGVKAEIIGGSKILIPEKERMLFWAYGAGHHEHSYLKNTPEAMAEHLRAHHYSTTRPTIINANETRHANLLVRIPSYKKYQIPNILGEERELKGNYELEVRISAQDIEPQNTIIKFHACTHDMKVLSSS